MVLHSMTHLFMNDDMHFALRDLSDLDLLLRHFGAREDFWSELVRRAEDLDLRRPLHDGLRQTQRVLHTPVPIDAWTKAQAFGRRNAQGRIMDAVWTEALRPPCARPARMVLRLALFALYVRGHWLRMPPWLLARHLATKTLQRTQASGQPADQARP
jgi:hypothetical protein